LPWLALACLGLPWLALACLALAWLGLAWLGLAWLGLAWLGLAWLGLAWLGLAWRIYQSAMSLTVTDFTYLEGRDGEHLVKELAAVDSNSNMFSQYVFKRPYFWEEVPMFNARINQAIDHGCNWNDGDLPYAELETVLHREA
jgi:hypothetical protein